MTLKNKPLDDITPAQIVRIEAWAWDQIGFDVEHFHSIKITPVNVARARVDVWFKEPVITTEFGREVYTGMSSYRIHQSHYIEHSNESITDRTVGGAKPGNAFGSV